MKLLVSDFDGTLYTKPRSTLDILHFGENLRCIRNWRAAGNAFALATGRGLASLDSHFPDYAQYCDYLILLDGAIIIDAHSNEPVGISYLPAELVARLPQVTAERAACIYYGYQAGLQYEAESPSGEIIAVRAWNEQVRDATALDEALRQEFAGQFRAFHYHTLTNYDSERLSWVRPELLELMDISPVDTGKANGIAALAEHEDFEEIITVGDDINDVEMIQRYDGYVVQDAKATVLVQFPAKRVVVGVYSLIEKLLG